jgi:hypothetical protein
MKLRRKSKAQRPKGPRIDATNDRAEALLFDEAFAEALWRRPTPL